MFRLARHCEEQRREETASTHRDRHSHSKTAFVTARVCREVAMNGARLGVAAELLAATEVLPLEDKQRCVVCAKYHARMDRVHGEASVCLADHIQQRLPSRRCSGGHHPGVRRSEGYVPCTSLSDNKVGNCGGDGERVRG